MTAVPLTGWDLAAWRMGQSDPALRSTVVGIIEIAGAGDVSVLTSRIRAAVAAHRVLRSVVRDGANGPELIEVEDFVAASCVEVLAGSATVRDVASAAAHLDFGYDEPLWKVFIIPGLTTYVIAALNHSIADGNGALAMTGFLIDEMQGSATEEPTGSPEVSDPLDNLKRALLPLVMRAVTDPKSLVADATVLMRSINTVLDQRSSDSGLQERGATFSSSWFRIPKSAVRAVTAGYGVSSHDALVAMAALSYREYHVRMGFGLSSISVNVPVAMSLADAVSNRMVVARLMLDLDSADTVSMLQQSRNALSEWRSSPHWRSSANWPTHRDWCLPATWARSSRRPTSQ